MQMDLEILTKLLQNFHEELKTCMEHEQDVIVAVVGGPPQQCQAQDPILLGDPIVDMYNNYLAQAKGACDNPIIQRMPEIEKLGEGDYVSNDTEHKAIPDSAPFGQNISIFKGNPIGKNPRFQKMREVAFATKQLLTVLESAIKTSEAKIQSEIVGLTTLLENLGQQIAYVLAMGEGGGQAVQPLITEYNRYLGLVLEAVDDPVLAKLFHPLESDGDDSHRKLYELRLAQSGLLSYLRKTHERAG